MSNKQEGVQILNYPIAQLFSSTNQLVLGGGQDASGFKTTLSSVAPAANRVLTLPALSADDSLVLLAQTQTLSNKTLSAPTINGSTTISGTAAAITFSGTGNHDITASSGTLRLGALTLTDAINGNSQNILNLGQFGSSLISDDSVSVVIGSGIASAGKLNSFLDLRVGADKLTVAASTGNTVVAGTLNVNGAYIATTTSTFSLLNTNATTINAFGTATAINWGSSSGTTTFTHNVAIASGKTLYCGGAARIGTTTLTPPTNGLVIGGNLQIGDTSTDADARINMYRTGYYWNSTKKTAEIFSTGDGAGTGGYSALSLQSLWNDTSLDFYIDNAGSNKYISCHQFYIDKSVIMMPTTNLYDSSLKYGTDGWGRNGLKTTSYASCYPFVDATNQILKFAYKDTSGNLRYAGMRAYSSIDYAGRTKVPAIRTADFTVGVEDTSFVCNGTGAITVTLPNTDSNNYGRFLYIKTIANQAVNSASSNVKPISSNTAGTAILSATAGKWAILSCENGAWVVMASN